MTPYVAEFQFRCNNRDNPGTFRTAIAGVLMKDWRNLLFFGTCTFLAVWILWWASSGYPLERQICASPYRKDECVSYDIILYSARQIVDFLNYWSVLVTAFATAAVAYFTWTIKRINDNQLRLSGQVERAYITVSGAPEVRIVDLGNETVEGPMGGGVTKSLGTQKKPTGAFQLTLSNHGKTPGEVWQIAVGFCDANNIPPNPEYAFRDFRKWIGPGVRDEPLMVPWGIPKLDPPAIYARVFYKDIFGGKYSSGFVHLVSVTMGISEPWPAPAAYTEERNEI